MNELSLKLKEDIVLYLQKQFGDKVFMRTRGSESFTGNQIAEEIQNETKRGMDMLTGLIHLTVQMVNRDIQNIQGFEKV